jgi:hypothetical protein
MLVADGAVGSGHGGLDIAEGGIDPFERGSEDRLSPRSGDDGLMRASRFGDAGETPEAVTDHATVGIEAVFGQPGDLRAPKAPHAAQFDADRLAFRGRFDGRYDRCLACRSPAPLAAAAFAAKIGIIHLDPSLEALAGITFHHHLHEFVPDLPGGGLGDPQPAAQFDTGDAALALGHVIHGPEPCSQRCLGRGEDRSGNERCLPSATTALVKRPRPDDAVLVSCAHRTFEAGRPTPCKEDIPALVLGPVEFVEISLTQPFLGASQNLVVNVR